MLNAAYFGVILFVPTADNVYSDKWQLRLSMYQFGTLMPSCWSEG